MYTEMDTVNMLYEMMKVEDEWAVRYENGFKWWPGNRAQTVEVLGEADGPEGERGYYISVRTEKSRVKDLNSSYLHGINILTMPFASMAGPVYNPQEGVVELCSWALIYEHVSGWMGPMLGMAAALQIFETDDSFRSQDTFRGHPENGVRSEPSEIANVISDMVKSGGEPPSLWSVQEFDEATDLANILPPVLLATGGGQGLSAEFPFGSFSSLLRMEGDQRHPIYGSGLLQLHHFPVRGKPGDDEKWIRKALELNEPAVSPVPQGYGFGSYLYRNSMITHASFIPNVLHSPGLLLNFLFAAGARASAMDKELAD